MNKKQLIARIQRHMGFGSTRDSAQAALNAVLDCIATYSKEERIELRGFGVFTQKEKKARAILHPISHERIELPARQELHFKPSQCVSNKNLRDLLES